MLSKLFTQESRTIAGAALIIGAATVVSRFLGLVRDRLLVSRFTVGDELDAYYASFQIPNLVFALLILGTLSVAFIPVFSEYLAKDKREEAWRVATSVLNLVGLVMGAISVALIIAAPLVVRFTAPGFSGEKLDLTVRLTRVMMLTPFFFALSAVFSSVLNSCKQFLTVSLAPLFYNGAIIFGILFLSAPFGIAGVAYGAVLGAALHLLIQLPGLLALGMKWRPVLELRNAGVREIGRLFLPRVFGVDISQLILFIAVTIGTTLGSGAVSLFMLASNVNGVPLGVFAIPFALAAFPSLSEAAAKGDRQEYRRLFASTFRQILFFLIPLTAMSVVLRVHVIRAILGGQGLSWHETRLAAAVLALFAASLAFQGLTPLLARAFYAIKNTVVPVLVSGIAVAFNIAAAYGLMAYFAPGGSGHQSARIWLSLYGLEDVRVLSLPLAFSLASVLQVALLAILLRRRFGLIGGRGLVAAFLKFFAGSLAAALVAARFVAWTGGIDEADPPARAIFQAAGASLAGSLTYLAALKILKSEEYASIAEALKRKLLRIEKPVPVQDSQQM